MIAWVTWITILMQKSSVCATVPCWIHEIMPVASLKCCTQRSMKSLDPRSFHRASLAPKAAQSTNLVTHGDPTSRLKLALESCIGGLHFNKITVEHSHVQMHRMQNHSWNLNLICNQWHLIWTKFSSALITLPTTHTHCESQQTKMRHWKDFIWEWFVCSTVYSRLRSALTRN